MPVPDFVEKYRENKFKARMSLINALRRLDAVCPEFSNWLKGQHTNFENNTLIVKQTRRLDGATFYLHIKEDLSMSIYGEYFSTHFAPKACKEAVVRFFDLLYGDKE